VEGGIVTRYEILEHPNEHGQALEAVEHHCALFDECDRSAIARQSVRRLEQLGFKVSLECSEEVA
jgi:hypothetical protein